VRIAIESRVGPLPRPIFRPISLGAFVTVTSMNFMMPMPAEIIENGRDQPRTMV